MEATGATAADTSCGLATLFSTMVLNSATALESFPVSVFAASTAAASRFASASAPSARWPSFAVSPRNCATSRSSLVVPDFAVWLASSAAATLASTSAGIVFRRAAICDAIVFSRSAILPVTAASCGTRPSVAFAPSAIMRNRSSSLAISARSSLRAFELAIFSSSAALSFETLSERSATDRPSCSSFCSRSFEVLSASERPVFDASSSAASRASSCAVRSGEGMPGNGK